jgi:hypothetical protein
MTLDFQIEPGFAARSITVKSLGSTTAKPFSYPYIEDIFAVDVHEISLWPMVVFVSPCFSLDLLMIDETRFIGV